MAALQDRRRINGPAGGTKPPVFASSLLQGDTTSEHIKLLRPRRTRKDNELRKIFLQTGIVPSASGSAYLELPPPHPTSSSSSSSKTFLPSSSSLKLLCTVYGPRPTSRSQPFSPNLLLNTHLKLSPFATRKRRGYLRDISEKDLSVHLETALRGVIVADRWPKSQLDISVVVLEGEEDGWWGDEAVSAMGGGFAAAGGSNAAGQGWGMMNVLSHAITVAGAAVVDAGVDCLGLISGGVAAVVAAPTPTHPESTSQQQEEGQREEDTTSIATSLASSTSPRTLKLLLDPAPTEHSLHTSTILATAVVGYMSSSDELTEVWVKGNIPPIEGYDHEALIDGAVECARAVSKGVVVDAVRESAERRWKAGGRVEQKIEQLQGQGDVEMEG